MVLDSVVFFCADRYGCDPEEVTLAASVDELNLTRDDLAELSVLLEEQFGVAVPDDVIDEVEILEDLVGYIEDRL